MNRRHPRWLSLGLLLGFILLGGCGKPQADDANRPLIWAADAEGGEPYIKQDASAPGGVVGFEKELADALARELGRPIQFKQYPFNSLVPGLDRGDFDFAMNGLEVTPDRAAKIRFSKPYYIYRQQLVVRNDEKRFSNYEELKQHKDLKVGTLEDTAAYRMLVRDGFTPKAYEDSATPFTDLEQGRLDAVVQDWPIALYLVQKKPAANSKLKLAGPPVEPGVYAIAFTTKNEALAQQIDAALERIMKSGELKKILTKWEIWNDEQAALEKGDAAAMLKSLKP